MLKMGSKVALPAPTAAPKPVVGPLVIEQPKKEKEKKPAATPSTGTESAFQIMQMLQASKGGHIATFANAIPPVRRLPTGIFEFDFYTCGGFPFNRYSIVYGPESSGKTNICLRAVASAQFIYPAKVAVWVNLEQTFDPLWALAMGVDIDRLIVVNASYGEEAVDVIDGFLRASDVSIVVVDSIATLVASKEIGQSTEVAEVGLSPMLVTRLVRKMMFAFAEKKRLNQEVAVILVNQIRYKIGVMFGNPENMPGGEALKFLSSLRIRLDAKNKIVKEVNPNLHVFKETTAKIMKSKVPVIGNTFTYDQCVVAHGDLQVGDTDSWSMVQKYLKQLDYLKKGAKGGWLIQPSTGPVIGEWKTLDPIKEKYTANEDFRLTLQELIIDAFKGQAMLVDDPDDKAPQSNGMMFQNGTTETTSIK